jgi:hypothetical protein
MTDNKDLKYTPQFKKEPFIPKTYEVRYMENKETSKSTRLAGRFGISKTYCYEDGPHEVQAEPIWIEPVHDGEGCIIL